MALPRHVEDLAREIFTHFKYSAKKKAIFKSYQEFLELDIHRILHPSQTRWLSLHPVVERILEQWEALEMYFADAVKEEKNASDDRILLYLRDKQVHLFFLFLDWVLPKFKRLNAYFQTERTVVTKVHQQMTSKIRRVGQKTNHPG